MQSPFYFKFYSFFRSHRSEKQKVLHQRLEWAKEIKALNRNLSRRIYDAFFFFWQVRNSYCFEITFYWLRSCLIYITLSWHILLNVTLVSREVVFQSCLQVFRCFPTRMIQMTGSLPCFSRAFRRADHLNQVCWETYKTFRQKGLKNSVSDLIKSDQKKSAVSEELITNCVRMLPKWEKKKRAPRFSLCICCWRQPPPHGSVHACSVTVQYREISGVEMEALNWISTHVRLASERCAAGSGPALHPLLIYRASREQPPATLWKAMKKHLWPRSRTRGRSSSVIHGAVLSFLTCLHSLYTNCSSRDHF